MSKGISNLFIRFRLYRSHSKNGKFAIYVRFTINQKRVELSTNEFVAAIAWDAEGQFVKGKTEEAQKVPATGSAGQAHYRRNSKEPVSWR